MSMTMKQGATSSGGTCKSVSASGRYTYKQLCFDCCWRKSGNQCSLSVIYFVILCSGLLQK